MSSFSDDRQSGELTKQARRRSVNQTNQKKIRENQQHIENYRLHRVEPHVPAEIRVSDDDEGLNGCELGDDVLSVLNAVEEGVEVTDGGDEAVGGVGGFTALGLDGGGSSYESEWIFSGFRRGIGERESRWEFETEEREERARVYGVVV
ncbi:beta-amylase [Sarracenia purpurea var. burkii]